MKFEKAIDFAAAPEVVFGMLADRAFREEVCREAGAETYDVSVAVTDTGLDSVIETASPVDTMPGIVRKILGSSLRLRQEEHWVSPTAGSLSVSIPGTPGTIRGSLRLEATPEGARQTVTADIKVGVPLVGAKIEALIGSGLGHVLKVQARVGSDWLSRQA